MNQNFSTSFTVEQSPADVFAAITNMRGWWSEEIEGATDSLGAIFHYHYKDVHKCTMQLTELVPNKKVVWLVQENYFDFTQDKTEWIGTEIIFELSAKDGKTEVRFTHQGLVPEYECFDICSNAWGFYITTSLRELITTGKGQPNHRSSTNLVDIVPENRSALHNQDFSISFTVDQSPAAVFAAINNARAWWTGEIAGQTDQLGAEWTYRHKDIHYSKHKTTTLIPNKKVVWLVVDAQLNFIQDKAEWVGTEIVFEITEQDGQTEVRFTHHGLAPAIECFEACSNAWSFYINSSLRNFITTGNAPAQATNSPKRLNLIQPEKDRS